MIDIEKYDDNNILFLKKYFFNKEQKICNFLVKSLEKQVKKVKVTNKETLARMDKLCNLTNSVVFIDDVELFLLDGTVNEPSYDDIRKSLYEVTYGSLVFRSYTQVDSMREIIDIYRFNRDKLMKLVNNYQRMLIRMKNQEKSLKKFVKVLYQFNFTKAKKMSKSQIEMFFKSKFKELEFF